MYLTHQTKQNPQSCFVRSDLQCFILYPHAELVKPADFLRKLETKLNSNTEAEIVTLSSLQPYWWLGVQVMCEEWRQYSWFYKDTMIWRRINFSSSKHVKKTTFLFIWPEIHLLIIYAWLQVNQAGEIFAEEIKGVSKCTDRMWNICGNS